jgi:hypothetical protein
MQRSHDGPDEPLHPLRPAPAAPGRSRFRRLRRNAPGGLPQGGGRPGLSVAQIQKGRTATFLACYQPAFGDRLHHVRGNHDAYRHQTYAPEGPQRIDVEGLTLALLDTTIPGHTTGQMPADQLEWLDDLASEADRPVLVLGHHHVWNPGASQRPDDYFGIHPDDSEALIAVVARHPRIVGYAAGHTHRNRVRRFPATGDRPWIEVACVKDYPGTWAEYRVFEGGVLQVHRRISTPEALAWTEQTRDRFAGAYAEYAFGGLHERCFALTADA